MQATRKVIPFIRQKLPLSLYQMNRRRGLFGMGDEDYAAFADQAFADTYQATGDYAQADAARQAYLNAAGAGPVAQPAYTPPQAPTPSSSGNLLSSSDLVKLATLGASAYVSTSNAQTAAQVAQTQAARGIAPPGYTYYGRAPAGYAYSNFQTQSPNYQGALMTPNYAYPQQRAGSVGYFSGSNTLLIAAVVALIMFEEKGHKK